MLKNAQHSVCCGYKRRHVNKGWSYSRDGSQDGPPFQHEKKTCVFSTTYSEISRKTCRAIIQVLKATENTHAVVFKIHCKACPQRNEC